MADYVRQHGCGIVIEDVSATDARSAIEASTARATSEFARRAGLIEARMFSQQAMIESYREIYS